MAKCLGPAVVAASLHALLLGIYVWALGGDPAALICVGAERAGAPPYEAVHFGWERHGYDGQFYYAVAQAPFERHKVGIDNPSFRQARVLYPALCWALSAGDVRLLPWAMPAINLLAIGALAGMGAFFAVRNGFSPWLGLCLPLAVDVALPALRDLTDVLSTCAICALLVAWILRGPAWAVI
ncbi:MAG: hypothetical protein ACRD36_03165, partial [Candidatus Acidiferrum sp.]